MNAQGQITYSARYTPWGDTLQSSGTGNFTYGYLGGLMDTSTGLLYMGSGQYYDPQTGRFLSRNAKPDQTNPYVPWGGNPTGALFTPLALLSLIYSRKKKRGTLDTIIILVVIGMSLGLSLTACQGVQVTVTPMSTPGSPLPTYIIHVATPTTSATYIATPSGTPVPTPSPTCTPTPSNAQMFYNAVITNSASLPTRFSVALLLAMGEVESGGSTPAYNNTQAGGAMQIRQDSGQLHQDKYTPDQEGYNYNVQDAIAVIDFYYNGITSGNIYTQLFDRPGQDPVITTVVRTVLYYNQGVDWIRNYRKPDQSKNKGYLGAVAGKLANHVPTDFPGQSDPDLVGPLNFAQTNVVNVCVFTTRCGY